MDHKASQFCGNFGAKLRGVFPRSDAYLDLQTYPLI